MLQVYGDVHAGYRASVAAAIDGDSEPVDRVFIGVGGIAIGGRAKDRVEVECAAFMAAVRGGASGSDIIAMVVLALEVMGRTKPGGGRK